MDERDQDPKPAALRHLTRPDGAPLRILVVDDEKDIFASSRIALKNAIGGIAITVEHANSAEAARARLAEQDFALAIVDVLMESRDAGVQLAGWTRATLADPFVRLVVRTGQPGATTESQVVRDFDLSDFRTKSLSAVQLTTMATGQLRAYQAITAYASDAWIAGLRAQAAARMLAGGDRSQTAIEFVRRMIAGQAGDAGAIERIADASPGCTPAADGGSFTVAAGSLALRVSGAPALNRRVADGLMSLLELASA